MWTAQRVVEEETPPGINNTYLWGLGHEWGRERTCYGSSESHQNSCVRSLIPQSHITRKEASWEAFASQRWTVHEWFNTILSELRAGLCSGVDCDKASPLLVFALSFAHVHFHFHCPPLTAAV